MCCLQLLQRAAARVRLRPCLAVAALGLAVTLAQAGETTNSIGMTLVDIPAGSFVMGSCLQDKKSAFLGESTCSNPDPEASTSETPQHRVSIRAFQMGKTEVTLGQFKRFIKATGNTQLVDDDFIKYNAYGEGAPVVQVSWNDAQAFITWLNQTDGGGFRLPSEAEWEYACRAGGYHKYCGSNNVGAVAWYDGNSGGHQRPVGGKQANAFGLHDMSGNAFEWVQDCWHDSYRGAPGDGSAWASGCSADGRGLRGGSWYIIAGSARAADRSLSSPGGRYGSFGFRLARTR
ncbi:formylglycine-generating enzyme family protein [Propionivibrio sp.]|uniref:formylglycine-generating enzyme family protein n=1 Tax=Propionivibrio sp. TaxID=2212460 RepID=UPI003BEF7A21